MVTFDTASEADAVAPSSPEAAARRPNTGAWPTLRSLAGYLGET